MSSPSERQFEPYALTDHFFAIPLGAFFVGLSSFAYRAYMEGPSNLKEWAILLFLVWMVGFGVITGYRLGRGEGLEEGRSAED